MSRLAFPPWRGVTGCSFIKKKCFVCGSLSHLIRDCDFYEKKMAKEDELKKQRVFNTSNGVAKPVWNNANRVNHVNHFVPRPVQLNVVRPNSNFVRPNVNTVRQNVNSIRSNVNTVRPKQPVPTSNSNSFSLVIIEGTLDQTPIVIVDLVLFELITTESEPTPIAESTTHPNSLSPEPDNKPIEHTFEQPSSEHQPL
ncbi:ribonuclease H-like domain-containing protein [Tanacetum coccineum]